MSGQRRRWRLFWRQREGPARKRGPLRRFFRLLLLFVAALYALCVLLVASLRWINPPVTMVQVQRRVESLLTGKEYKPTQVFVPLQRISVNLQRAVVAAEDGRFYQHHGFDWQEMEKALDERDRRGRLRGASTITQQLVKNLFLTTYRSPLRKAFEFVLTPVFELLLSKQRILELYLNVIEWGPGVYGAEAAARYHYGVSASGLGRDQAVRLAACIPNPRRWRPQRMDGYSADILERMERMGW